MKYLKYENSFSSELKNRYYLIMYQNICIIRNITIVSNETTMCPFHSFINGSGLACRVPLFFWRT